MGITSAQGRVAALAGRRIDSPTQTTHRFPLSNVAPVRNRLLGLLEAERVQHLICSAACGADLVALQLAMQLKIPYQIILPFPIESFREKSVVDRPGDWGGAFDQVIANAATNSITVLSTSEKEQEAYRAVTAEIIRLAVESSTNLEPIAIAVWDGIPHGEEDASADFVRLAKAAMIPVLMVQTC